jgi:tetratricopeptide (TPR) repeat protein
MVVKIIYSFLLLHFSSILCGQTSEEYRNLSQDVININTRPRIGFTNEEKIRENQTMIVLIKKQIDYLSKAIEVAPFEYINYKLRAEAYLNLSSWEILLTGVLDPPKPMSLRYSLTDILKAIELYNGVNYNLYFTLCEIYENLDNHSAAVKKYTEILELAKNEPLNNRFKNPQIEKNDLIVRILCERADAKAELKDYRGTISDYNQALIFESTHLHAGTYIGLGYAKIMIGDKNGGCLDLSKAGEMGDPRAYYLIKNLCN